VKDIESSEFNKFIHSVRNPLNSISLHAELGKMLLEEQANSEKIKHTFAVILEQCSCCEKILTEMRCKNTDSVKNDDSANL
jgi:light-regulated signal transduction histidine kinase (bacteriophytochrome)